MVLFSQKDKSCNIFKTHGCKIPQFEISFLPKILVGNHLIYFLGDLDMLQLILANTWGNWGLNLLARSYFPHSLSQCNFFKASHLRKCKVPGCKTCQGAVLQQIYVKKFQSTSEMSCKDRDRDIDNLKKRQRNRLRTVYLILGINSSCLR